MRDRPADGSRTMYEVLGPIRVVDRGGEVVIPGLLQRRLLVALLLHRNRVVSADRLTEMLWPEPASAPGAGALQSHLSRLRQRVPSLMIDHHPPGYVLRVDESDLDVHRFERAVLEAVASRRDGGDGALVKLDDALRLWRGDPFAELVDVDDGRIEMQRLNELRLRAMEERFDLLIEAGRAAEVIADLESYVAREPLREQPRRMLIDALSAVGRRAEALRVFDAYRRVLAEELGVAPSPELRARHDALLVDDDERAPSRPPRAAKVNRGVPHQLLSSFVGRADLIEDLERRVGDARLITLIGPGGVGKTRLALETARRLRDSFADGAIFCDLTEAGPARVATVVLAALKIESRSGQDDFDRLADVLRTDRCLLVLDNCEHVLDEAAALAEGLLLQSEHVVMIATTRERLGVDGEQLCVVPPLSSEAASASGLSPAVELLRDRARSVVPHFELDSVSRNEVEELCRRLDGLPLAIELAAGRLQTLSLSEVREGLEASLSVLRGGRRTVGRHRSVEAALEWSYQLLHDLDRAVLHAAALFAGAFDAADVAHVLDADPVATRDRLARLVECSLAHRVGTHFALLDVVRRFAVERAPAHSTDVAMAGANLRHAERMLIRATALAASFVFAQDASPVTELNRMLADFRKAVGTAVDGEDAETALGIVTALRDLALNAMVPELMGWGVRAAEVGARQRHPLTPDAYAAAGQGAWKRGDLAEMRRLLQLAEAMADELGVGVRFEVLGTCGTEHLAHGRLREAVDCFRRSLECPEAIGHPLRQAESGATLAICMSYAHDPDATEMADHYLQEVLRSSGGAISAAWCWYASGECRIDNDPVRARELLERALELARRGGGSFVEGVAGASVASLDVRAGRHSAAVAHYRWLLPLWLRAGVRSPFWTAMRSVVDLLEQVGSDQTAARLLGAVMSPSSGHEVFGDDDARLSAIRGRLVERLGDSLFEKCFREGSELDDIGAAAEATAAFAVIA